MRDSRFTISVIAGNDHLVFYDSRNDADDVPDRHNPRMDMINQPNAIPLELTTRL